MATSQPDDYGLGKMKVGATDSRASGSSVSSGTSSQSSSSSSNTSATGTQSSTTNTRNMSSANEAALNKLIQMLMGGGTPEMRQQQATRDQEVNAVRGQRADYSKGAAFNDAQGLIALQLRRTMEQLLPSINAAAEDAGSSGGALRALLLQDVAQRAAESSSALGVQTATQYGGISANLSAVLENLTRVNPAATEALIQALNVAKGANVSSTTNSVTTNNQTTNQIGSVAGTDSKKTSSNEEKDYAPFSSTPVNNSPIYFGPSQAEPTQVPVGSTLDTLMQLAKDNAWSGYKI